MSFAVIRTVRKALTFSRLAEWDAETVVQLLDLLVKIEAEQPLDEWSQDTRELLDQIRACFGDQWPHDWQNVNGAMKAKLLAEHHIDRIGRKKRK